MAGATAVPGLFPAGPAGRGAAIPTGGDTFAVQNSPPSSSAFLDALWANGALTDFVRVRSPRRHDANQGIRLPVNGIAGAPLIPHAINNLLYPADALTVEIETPAEGTGPTPKLTTEPDPQSG